MPNLYTLFKDFQTNFGLLGSLVICGCFLILVNVLTHAWVTRREADAKDKDHMQQNLKPLLQGCTALISRLTEILVTGKTETLEAIQAYKSDTLEKRLSEDLKTSNDFNRHETTAYRLINFWLYGGICGRKTAIHHSPHAALR